MSNRMTTSEFIKKANEKHNNKYDYSKCEYTTSRAKVEIICPIHGSFMQRASSHLTGCGCSKCAYMDKWTGEKREQKLLNNPRRYTTEQFIEKAKKIHGDKYDYSQVNYVNSKTKVKIFCPKHGFFEQQPDSHLMGHICNRCAREQMWQNGSMYKKVCTKERQKKMEKTCQKRYGAKTYMLSKEGKAKVHAIKSTHEFKQKMHDIISSDEVQHKTKETNLKRYGEISPMRCSDIRKKLDMTKKKNNSFKTSKSEDMLYELLCKKFDKADVIRQYSDDRYPFKCDFYIRSLDLFIELNASWTHGKHWFDPKNQKDLTKLDEWYYEANEHNKLFYFSAIDTWTKRDVKKRNMAVQNKLNYVVFWNNDLSDAMKWLSNI